MTVVAVTGGAGFIGSAVCKALESKGYKPISFDLRAGFDIRKRFDFGDDIGGVIHLAGVLGTHELLDDIEGAIETNVKGTLNVLDAVVRSGRRAPYVGITMPPVFPSVYTATKIAAAAFERVYRHEYRLPMAKVRAFNAFGPGQAHGAGHPQKIIPAFAVAAWRGEPMPVWGNGMQMVDLIGTTELARVIAETFDWVRYNENIAASTEITVDGGSGQSLRVNDVAAMVAAKVVEAGGPQVTCDYKPMRRGEIPTDIAATREGWHLLSRPPTFDMDEFRRTVISYRDHPSVTS